LLPTFQVWPLALFLPVFISEGRLDGGFTHSLGAWVGLVEVLEMVQVMAQVKGRAKGQVMVLGREPFGAESARRHQQHHSSLTEKVQAQEPQSNCQ